MTQMFDDAIWTWFNEPMSVYSSTYDSTYTAWIDSAGAVWVGQWHHARREKTQIRLKTGLAANDHSNPAVCVLDNGKILICYSEHNGDSWCRLSTAAGDIREFGAEVTVNTASTDAYAHVFQMGDTAGTIYWFFRRTVSGSERPIYFRTSTDDGATWSSVTSVVDQSSQRPYFRIWQTSSTRLDFAVTTGQPNEATNSLYHFYMTVDAGGTRTFLKSDATDITSSIPFDMSELTLVYDGSTDECWVWDICNNSEGLRIAYVVFTNTNQDHEYFIATYSGGSWTSESVCDGGTTATADYLYATEANYSGGICLDPNDADQAYVSREYGSGDFRVERWAKSGTWAKAADISGNTSSVNARPTATIGLSPTQVYYWRGTYTSFTSYSTALHVTPDVTLRTAKTSSPAWQSGYGPKYCEVYWLLTEGSGGPADLVNAYDGSLVGSPSWSSDSFGGYLTSLSTSNYVTFDSFAGAFDGATRPNWMAVLFSNSDSTNYGFAVSLGSSTDADPVFGIGINGNSNSNDLFAFIRGDTLSTPSTIFSDQATSSDGDLHVLMAIQRTTATKRQLYFDGELIASDALDVGTMTLDRATVGCLRRSGVGQGFGGNVHTMAAGYGGAPDPTWLYHDWISGQFAGTYAADSGDPEGGLIGGKLIRGGLLLHGVLGR
jgi:hypothetical protein